MNTLDDLFNDGPDDGLAADDLTKKVQVLTAKKGADKVWSTEEDGSTKDLETGAPWEDGLIRDAKGYTILNHYNVCHVLRDHPEWRNVIAFNEFNGRKMVMQPIPGSREPRKYFKPRELQDKDILVATAWLNRHALLRVNKGMVADAIDEVVHEAAINPVKDYLLTCAAEWDGKHRIDTWLETYLSSQPETDAQKQYTREVGLRWLISAVARVFQPGCKADGALILEGIQGAGKSTAAKILAGADFFGDNLPPMTSKEASAYVRGRWIIEMAELANVTKAEVEVVKAFISRTEERFRPPYGRNEVCYPRQCVFIGSTNRTDYLRDDTGNRRFWPVPVGKVRLKELEADRNMLWGEAVKRYEAGEQWWLSAAVERIAQVEQADRLIEDPWTSDVLDKVAGKTEVCVTQVLTDMSIDLGRRDRMMSNRVVSILMQNGWMRQGRFTHDPHRGQNRFVRVDQLVLKQPEKVAQVEPARADDDLF